MNVLIIYVNSKRQVELFCVTFLVESLFLNFIIKLNSILYLAQATSPSVYRLRFF